jgi:glycosyltransferase involved in cell wall biosynthesis
VRILFLANHLNVGGISSYLLTLAGGLKQKGHQLYLASAGGDLEDRFIRAGIILLRAPLKTKNEISLKIFFSFWKLKKAMREYEIDLIHSHSRTTQVLGSLLGYFSAKPHIFTCHGFFKPKLPRRICGCWGQKVIAISQQVKEHLVSDFKLNPDKISVIHNGIDTKEFGDNSARIDARKKFGVSEGFLLGMIARLSDVKGHKYLIQAMPEILKIFPEAKLLIVGQGRLEPVLTRQVQDLGLKEKVIFVPEAKQTKEILAALDVFVMPSLQEGLGLALMEAMAQGLAVVGSSVGGIKTLIQDKRNGLLVAPSDPVALSQAIIKLLSDSGLRHSLGEEARKFIIANFSQEEMVDKTEILYRQFVLGQPKFRNHK